MTQPGPDQQTVQAKPLTYYPPPPLGAIPAQRQPEAPTFQPRNGFGIASLVLAIVGLVFGLVPFTGFIAFICGAVGLLFGVLAIGRVNKGIATNRGMSIIAAVLSACAVLLGVWGLVMTFQTVAKLGMDLSSIESGIQTPSTGSAPPRLGSQPRPAAPALLPGQISGDGTYAVGSDIQPGTYRTDGPSARTLPNCYWERSKDTSGEFSALIANDIVKGPATVTIKPTDGGFKSNGCQPWTKVR